MKNKNSFLNAFLQKAGSFLFPSNLTCDICKKEEQNGKIICSDCLEKISFTHNACDKCGCNIFSGSYCIRCKSQSFNFDFNIAVTDYSDFTKNIIMRFKNGDKYLYKAISRLMTDLIIKKDIVFDEIAFVPVTKKVLRQRGYNQSRLLAESIGEELKKPVYTGLIKIKETLFQKNCPARVRLKNVENAFDVVDKTAVKGKSLLLIDDVITTGSTLSECAKTLKKGGAKNVVTCTFAAVTSLIVTE